MKIIAERVGLDPKNIFGMVWGEHGANSVIPWSAVQVAGQSLDDYCAANGLPLFDKEELLAQTKQAGLEIFNRKMNTNHGIAGSVFRIIRAIGINEYSVLPVGILLQGEYGLHDVVLNVPAVISSRGVERIVNYRLPADERARVRQVMHYEKNSVGAIMEFGVITVRPDVTLGTVQRYLRRLGKMPDNTTVTRAASQTFRNKRMDKNPTK